MEKKITGYTTVDISQWHRKEHFEAFQSVAQCTYNQTVQLDITAFLKTVKKKALLQIVGGDKLIIPFC
ncbi:TPA: chloramphenicol acetyltransferase [Escherichia coli]|nr:chloramphenicol acetyltransferase [Escherichia coli]